MFIPISTSKNQQKHTFFFYFFLKCSPRGNSTLKIDGWKMTYPFLGAEFGLFSGVTGYVSFQGG